MFYRYRLLFVKRIVRAAYDSQPVLQISIREKTIGMNSTFY